MRCTVHRCTGYSRIRTLLQPMVFFNYFTFHRTYCRVYRVRYFTDYRCLSDRIIVQHCSNVSGSISFNRRPLLCSIRRDQSRSYCLCCCHKHGVFLFYPFKIVSKQWRQQINAHKNMFNMSKYKSTAPMMYSSAVKSICNAFKSQQIQLPKMSEINAGQI